MVLDRVYNYTFVRTRQVRRYVYNDVVRLDDLERLIDCSFVQVIYLEYHIITL
jgi:hypothetical protein